MKDDRKSMIESKYRANSVEENLRLWKEMKLGSAEVKGPYMPFFFNPLHRDKSASYVRRLIWHPKTAA